MIERKGPQASTLFTRLWVAWAIIGVGAALVIIAANELGWRPFPNIWWWWAVPGVLGGGALEVAALLSPQKGNTLSEHIWKLHDGWRSLIVVGCVWAAWWLATGSAWPSAGIAFLLWCAWHFAIEGGDLRRQPSPA